MSLNENNAYTVAQKLAFPRLVGSEGEKKAINIVVEEFKKAGFDTIYREKFMTSLRTWVISKTLFLIISLNLILIGIFYFLSPWVTLILIGTYIIFVLKLLKVSNTSQIILSKNPQKNFETENLYTTLKSKNSKASVIFMSHWDSKSQRFSSATRIMLIMLFTIGFFILTPFYLIIITTKIIFQYDLFILDLTLLIITCIIAMSGISNFFNKTGNLSPGAYDNAAAVGVLMELAQYLKNNPLNNLDFIFLSTSSEELSLGGAKEFINAHQKEFNKASTFFINFDPIGGNELIRVITSFGIPRKTSSEKLNQLFLTSAKELKLPAKDYYLPTGAWSDYMPIVRKGFEACWIVTVPGLKYIHTKHDDMRLIDKNALKNVLNLTLTVIKKLNEEYN